MAKTKVLVGFYYPFCLPFLLKNISPSPLYYADHGVLFVGERERGGEIRF